MLPVGSGNCGFSHRKHGLTSGPALGGGGISALAAAAAAAAAKAAEGGEGKGKVARRAPRPSFKLGRSPFWVLKRTGWSNVRVGRPQKTSAKNGDESKNQRIEGQNIHRIEFSKTY